MAVTSRPGLRKYCLSLKTTEMGIISSSLHITDPRLRCALMLGPIEANPSRPIVSHDYSQSGQIQTLALLMVKLERVLSRVARYVLVLKLLASCALVFKILHVLEGLSSRVDHHKRNLLIIKPHLWILWKLTKYTTTIKIFEFGWEKIQKSTCSSKTTFLCIKYQNSVLQFYGTVLIIKRHKIFFMDRFMVTNFESKIPSMVANWVIPRI